jgi:hypothetical protein
MKPLKRLFFICLIFDFYIFALANNSQLSQKMVEVVSRFFVNQTFDACHVGMI